MVFDRALITGLGVVCGAGTRVEQVLTAFRQGSVEPGPVDIFNSSIQAPVFQVPGQLDEATIRGQVEVLMATVGGQLPASNLSRTVLLTLRAVMEALNDAGNPQFRPGFRLGVCLGTTVASQLNSLPFYQQFRSRANPSMAPVIDYLNGNLAEVIARGFRANGPRTTVVNACSSGAEAIGIGLGWLRAGWCDAVIAGGADELNRVPFCGFNSLGIMSSQPCRPFDRHRQGLNLGEGAGILILENESSARLRKFPGKLRVAGYGAACDAYHLTAPHPQGRGLRMAVQIALAQAGIEVGDVDFVNAHGTATVDNDLVESRVLAELFGLQFPFLSTKGYTGHTLGAAGGVEAVFTALALREGWLPASAGLIEPDPELSIVPLRDKLDIASAGFGLSTSLAFGGNNAALLISRVSTPSTRPLIWDCLSPGLARRNRQVVKVDGQQSQGMVVEGMGMVGTRGRGMGSLEEALRQGWRPPETGFFHGLAQSLMHYPVAGELLQDRGVMKNMRRADRFCKMAVLAAHDAWHSGSDTVADRGRVGIIVATGFGPHVRTFEFLDGILDFGDEAVSPTAFSHSVHNAAASYLASHLQIQGPVQTVTDFEFAFPQALRIAQDWLDEGRVDTVLLGTVEELGQVMLHTYGRLLRVAATEERRACPLAFTDARFAGPGEGALFFRLTRSIGPGLGLGSGPVIKYSSDLPSRETDLTILDDNGMVGNESGYRKLCSGSGLIANYHPLFGAMATGLSWQSAVAVLSLVRQYLYASPLAVAASDLPNLCQLGEQRKLESIKCCKLGRDGRQVIIWLSRSG